MDRVEHQQLGRDLGIPTELVDISVIDRFDFLEYPTFGGAGDLP
jgi:hypothetical protein